jgi:hypothetical protein
MLYIVNDQSLIQPSTNEKSIVPDGESLAEMVFGIQPCVSRNKQNDISAYSRQYLESLTAPFSNPHARCTLLFLFSAFSYYIYNGIDVYIVCNNKYTVKGILLYEIIGFITDRYNTNYTEINCMDDYDGIKELEIAAPYLEVLDKDIREMMMSNIRR